MRIISPNLKSRRNCHHLTTPWHGCFQHSRPAWAHTYKYLAKLGIVTIRFRAVTCSARMACIIDAAISIIVTVARSDEHRRQKLAASALLSPNCQSKCRCALYGAGPANNEKSHWRRRGMAMAAACRSNRAAARGALQRSAINMPPTHKKLIITHGMRFDYNKRGTFNVVYRMGGGRYHR